MKPGRPPPSHWLCPPQSTGDPSEKLRTFSPTLSEFSDRIILALSFEEGRNCEVLRGLTIVERVHVDPRDLALRPLHACGKGAAIAIYVVEFRNGALSGI